jgi:hypothetical protein
MDQNLNVHNEDMHITRRKCKQVFSCLYLKIQMSSGKILMNLALGKTKVLVE